MNPNHSEITRQMFLSLSWEPEPQWSFYKKYLLEYGFELHQAAEDFFNRYSDLEIYYPIPEIMQNPDFQDQLLESGIRDEAQIQEMLDEWYQQSFTFGTTDIQYAKIYGINLREYYEWENKQFLPVGSLDIQYGQNPVWSLVYLSKEGEVLIPDLSTQEAKLRYASPDIFFGKIAEEFVLGKRCLFDLG